MPNNVTVAEVTLNGVETLTNKTMTTQVLNGTPTTTGQLGRDATQLAANYFDNGQLGTLGKIIAAGVGTQTFTNNGTGDQDFTALYTLPANALFTDKAYRVSYMFEAVQGTSTATLTHYLKLGTTKGFAVTATNLANTTTRSIFFTVMIVGRAAPGASVAVSVAPVGFANLDSAVANTVNQPITGIATNGTLAIQPGVTWAVATDSQDTLELQAWMVEELN